MIAAHPIRIAAALLLRPDGRTLLVRKRGTTVFMQPGGKMERGETPVETLARELDEELGLRIAATDASPLGLFEADAANEPGYRVRANLFLVRTAAPPVPAAEIAQVG